MSIDSFSAADSGIQRRLALSAVFRMVCRIAVYLAITILLALLSVVIYLSIGWLDLDFFQRGHFHDPEKAGILSGLWGSFWLIGITTMLTLPIGIGAAIYMEEYASDTRLTRFIKLNLSNLAGVPSIVYGMLGLMVFVKFFGLVGNPVSIKLLGGLVDIPIPFGRTVIAGAMTMSLLILPVVIIASQEALRAVPKSIRVSSLALGATRWQTIWRQVLPASLPGIATGAILAISRAIGETAPLIMVGAVSLGRVFPGGIQSPSQLITEPGRIANAPFDIYTAMPIAIYAWIREPEKDFTHVAAAGIVVLMVLLTCINGIAVYYRHRARKKVSW
ncbi:MAG: phosphate ABC transporter permease PstA [Fuerstiella sp.]